MRLSKTLHSSMTWFVGVVIAVWPGTSMKSAMSLRVVMT